MEVSFSQEIRSLRLGAGDTFHGEGILAITKALLQSGVSYVGGYQGAPMSPAEFDSRASMRALRRVDPGPQHQGRLSAV